MIPQHDSYTLLHLNVKLKIHHRGYFMLPEGEGDEGGEPIEHMAPNQDMN